MQQTDSPQAAEAQTKVTFKQRISRIPVLRVFVPYKTYTDGSPRRNAVRKRVRFSVDTKLYDEADDPSLDFSRERGNRKIEGFPVAGSKEYTRFHFHQNQLFGPRDTHENPYQNLPRDFFNIDPHALDEVARMMRAAQCQADRRTQAPDLSRRPSRVLFEVASRPGEIYELRSDIVDAVYGGPDPERTIDSILESLADAL